MNNKKTASTFIRIFGISWLASLAILVYTFLSRTAVSQNFQILMLVVVVLLPVIFAKGGFYYIEIANSKGNLLIRYFNLFPIGRKYKALQIPLERYSHYEIKGSMGVLFSFLYVYEDTARGLARYQPIGLTALRSEEKENLRNILDQIKKTNK